MAVTGLPPGPRLPRVAQAVLFPLAQPWLTRHAYARFGPVATFRPGTGPPVVLTTDRDAVRRLLTGDPLARRHGNDSLRPMLQDRSTLLLEPGEHLARRKLLLPPFHGERVRSYAALMETLIEEDLDRWQDGDVVAMLPVAQDLTIEVIMQAVLGIRDRSLRKRLREAIDDAVGYPASPIRRRLGLDGRAARAPRLPRRLRDVLRFVAQIPSPAVMTHFPETKQRSRLNPIMQTWGRVYAGLLALLDEQIAATRSDPALAERDDILAMLVQARDEDGIGLTDEDLRDELVTLITAGHETTASTIAWATDELAHDREVQRRARQAADEGDDAYLGGLVKEVLRKRTPLTIAAARRLTEPFTVGPHTIPPGTHILVDNATLHRDPRLWPEPERLRPERFLEGSPEPYSWLPFGGGAHRCIGSGLAELEIKVALRAILRRVELEPVERARATPVRRGVILVPHGGGKVRVRVRAQPSPAEDGQSPEQLAGVGGLEVGDAQPAA